jgi:hypothetical protein
VSDRDLLQKALGALTPFYQWVKVRRDAGANTLLRPTAPYVPAGLLVGDMMRAAMVYEAIQEELAGGRPAEGQKEE